jgi:hypothetical protein
MEGERALAITNTSDNSRCAEKNTHGASVCLQRIDGGRPGRERQKS